MTGPELFRDSLALAHGDPGCACETTGCIHEQVQLQQAQVYATLALAAATALGGIYLDVAEGSRLAADWNHAIGVSS